MKILSAALGAAALAASAALAQPPTAPMRPQIIRGEILAVGADQVRVKTRDGGTLQIALAKDWTVQVTRRISASEIKPGSFIGTAEMPQADGSGLSLEVHVFPPGVKMGEGHYGWDLQQGSMMTNGTVGKVVSSPKGRELDVDFTTGARHIVVPPSVPIVSIGPGDRALAAPGAKAFVIALVPPGGSLTANAVVVGENGAPPPM